MTQPIKLDQKEVKRIMDLKDSKQVLILEKEILNN